MPCYERPQRTIRAITDICNQNIDGWEAKVVGDGCRYMDNFVSSNYFSDMIFHAESKGNILSISNNKINKGGCGYYIINSNIQSAVGKYFLFLSNDDIILPNHFENYLSGIENTDLDFAYYDTYIEPIKRKRISELKNGSIGHSELIIRTEYLRRMPLHGSNYGHDWDLILNMIKDGAKSKKIEGKPFTYIVKGVGELRTDIID